MTERELNIALREMARSQGLCDKWYNEWSDDSTIDECLDRFVRGFDFVQEKDYPPLDFIRKNFDKELLHKHNIYLDEEVKIDFAKSGYYIFLGNCTGSIEASGFCAVTIYLRHTSKINVISKSAARVFVTFYDQSECTCISDGIGKIRQYDRRKSII